jgi:opacity protein-like surface antigen
VFNIALGYKSISEITYPNSPSKNYSNSSFATSFQSPFGTTLLLGMGASYDLNKKTTVKIEPIYRQSLNSTFQLKSNGVYYSIGTNVGVSYRF